MRKLRYVKLIEPCKSCLGCMRLENPFFKGDKNCRYSKPKKNRIVRCDPEKNIYCAKNTCYIFGGPCNMTNNPRFKMSLIKRVVEAIERRFNNEKR